MNFGVGPLLAPDSKALKQSLEIYRAAAVAVAKKAVAALELRQVAALVTGSLAEGSFALHSDVDFLIVECPRRMKYVLEGIVEDALGLVEIHLELMTAAVR